ncbi:Por secretion system C-terminal sorting domain-containing protein [Reichenbachiella faecimaris]|uniref:Por secretion system C-terminal sorting domain-containing protein n=1 Tax=Reichenbachiella faecimaris TaxID=692418 RepID=A0A1W2GMR2_REIFA|nr:carbohydrate-binding protein [Reichenbachiella faecimaris]SMD37960.1 Por secretion system C-terminal sorting domain-containing protein [Reichenbachiella faecimaris]
MKHKNKTIIDGNRHAYYFPNKVSTMLLFVAVLLTSLGVMAQDPPQYGTPFQGVPHRMDANIYQMNLREYSSSRDIAGARANLQRVSDLGINVLYLMPIFPLGVENNPDGSPYSHKDLKSIAPDLGTLNDLRGLVEDAHNLGMSVIIDWVANQTAWDHPWITQHPDWYHQDGSGNIEYPCPDPGNYCFTDVAWLDLDNSAASAAMIDAMRYWIFAANVDGFRFDWADKAPPAFWTNAVSNLRGISSHDLLLLAEGSNEGASTGCTPFCGDNEPGYHYGNGFDYIFGTNFYWNVMKKVWDSGEPVTNLDGVTTGEYIGADPTQLVARYLSNHDDYNAEGSPFSFLQGGRAGVMAAFALATYHRSVPFIYNGMEVGNTNPLPYPWNSGTINWTQDLTVYSEMQTMLTARNNSEALRRGLPVSYINPDGSNPNVFAFTKESGGEKVAILINPRGGSSSFTIPAGMAGTYNDIFTPGGSSVSWTTGQNVTLDPYEYIVLTNANVPVVEVTGISVSPTSATINEGLTQAITPSIQPANATNRNVTWSSSNPGVATVSAGGVVTGISVGTATITVTTEDGDYQASTTVTVNPATTFTVHFYTPSTWTSTNIYYWDAEPTGVLPNATWPGVAMTAEGGDWYAHTFTNISSTNLIFNGGNDDDKTENLTRNGTDGWYLDGVWYNSQPDVINVTGVSVSPGNSTIDLGTTLQLSASVSPSNANNQAVIWSSSSTAIATVDANGLVTGVGAGTASITATTLDGGFTDSSLVTVDAGPGVPIPGTIQAESWTAMSGVQTEATTDTGGGTNVGWIDAGDWIDYNVNVTEAGGYAVDFRVASGASGGTLELRNSSGTTLCSVTFGGTGGWQSWTTVSADANLSAGTQTLRIYAASSGINLNWIEFSPTTVPSSLAVSPSSLSVGSTSGNSTINVTSNVNWTVSDNQSWISTSTTSGTNNGSFTISVSANSGSARTGSVTVSGDGITRTISVLQSGAGATGVDLPGIVQAEDWDAMSGVQTEGTSDAGGGLNVGWINAGDWMDYNVNVVTAGVYTVSFRMASGAGGGTMELRNSAGATLGSATVGGTGGWQNWTTVTTTATLTAGSQTIRLYAASSDFNINWVQFDEQIGGGSGFYIVNRWQGTYLFDAGTNVSYGGFSTAADHQWELVDVDGHQAIQNSGTGQYMNIESLSGTVECTSISTGAWSAQWTIEDYDGHKRLKNRWQSSDYIHVENLTGSAQSGSVYEGAYSGHWSFESATGARVREAKEQIEAVQQVLLYPNPVQDVLHLKFPSTEKKSTMISILDTSGRTILSNNIVSNSTGVIDLDLSSLKRGIYVVVVNDLNEFKSFKVTKL